MKIIDRIRKKVEPSKDYIFQELIIADSKVSLIYNETLCDGKSINEFVMYRLTTFDDKKLHDLKNNLPNCNTIIIPDNQILNYLNNGFVIVIFNFIYACEFKSSAERTVSLVQSELSLGGSKDSFTENYNVCLGLIRKRIRDSRLKVLNIIVGKYTNTKIGILYIDDIVKMDLVYHVYEKLKKIDIDGIIDSSYLKFSLENNNLFPTILMTERPDKASMALLEGKIVLLVDNSPYALILPSFFIDFFHTADDYFQKSFNASFIRVIRLVAFFISIFLPAIYISITTRNYDLVPSSLLFTLKAGRSFVPFPAYLEALFMIICFEILKESDLRMSTTSGSAISILGGLVLGNAAVSAGVVSPIMIIIIAISSISGLIFSSIELGNALRIYKILLLILASLFGIYGVLMGFSILLYNIFSTEVFGYKYLYFDKNEIKDSILKFDTKIRRRNSKLTKNIIRGRYK